MSPALYHLCYPNPLDSQGHNTINHLKERGVERGHVQQCPLKGRERALTSLTSLGTISRTTNTMETSERQGSNHFGASPRAQITSWIELNWAGWLNQNLDVKQLWNLMAHGVCVKEKSVVRFVFSFVGLYYMYHYTGILGRGWDIENSCHMNRGWRLQTLYYELCTITLQYACVIMLLPYTVPADLLSHNGESVEENKKTWRGRRVLWIMSINLLQKALI